MDEIRKRDTLHRKYKNTRLEEDGLMYRSSRKKVQVLINTKKQRYIQNSLEENKRNAKKLLIFVKKGLTARLGKNNAT